MKIICGRFDWNRENIRKCIYGRFLLFNCQNKGKILFLKMILLRFSKAFECIFLTELTSEFRKIKGKLKTFRSFFKATVILTLPTSSSTLKMKRLKSLARVALNKRICIILVSSSQSYFYIIRLDVVCKKATLRFFAELAQKHPSQCGGLPIRWRKWLLLRRPTTPSSAFSRKSCEIFHN